LEDIMRESTSASVKDQFRVVTTLDLDAIVFDGDRDLRRELSADELFAEIVAEVEGAAAIASARRDLLRSALRLTPKISPDAFRAVEHATKTLGIKTPVELFCVPSAEINAFVAPPEGGTILIGVSSAALENLDVAELRFVIGHELGHAIFDHFALAPELLSADERIAPVHVARLYAWMRYAELTADRVGLLCAADLHAAVRAFFKITSGLTAARFLENATEAAEQYSLLKTDIESREEDWFNTHPYSPLRLRALDLFARSAPFRRLIGQQGGEFDEQALEREVAQIMALMDPSFLSDNAPCTAEIREFLALGGLAVAFADGELAHGEQEALGQLCGDRGVIEDAAKLLELSDAAHEERMLEVARTLNLKLSPLQRQKIVEDLVAIAVADHAIHEEELNALAFSAGLLDVNPLFVEDVLARLGSALD
jgi:uncharacterized tellurite resistance protein B-like protein